MSVYCLRYHVGLHPSITYRVVGAREDRVGGSAFASKLGNGSSKGSTGEEEDGRCDLCVEEHLRLSSGLITCVWIDEFDGRRCASCRRKCPLLLLVCRLLVFVVVVLMLVLMMFSFSRSRQCLYRQTGMVKVVMLERQRLERVEGRAAHVCSR